MKKTVFIDVTGTKYDEIATYDYDITCNIGEHVDFTEYNPIADQDIFLIQDIIYLPNESKKIIEVRLIQAKGLNRDERTPY